MPTPDIFSFGLKQTRQKENRALALIEFIREHRIDVALDVRHNRSNHFTRWVCSGKNLEQLLVVELAGECIYLAFPQLGIPSITRKYYKNNSEGAKRWYLEHLDVIDALKLLAPYREKRIVLLCVEDITNPKTPHCHRIWLKEYLEGAWRD